MIALYYFLLFILSIYSYALVDPNLTLVSSDWWAIFRLKMVELGYYRRDISWLIYLVIIILLFVFNYFFIQKYKHLSVIKIAIFTGLILLFSYPFLSHDFFNYMFDAKIATYYHKNPYFYKALDFPSDPWLRFLQWTHRTYPYGPVFLLITLAPSFLSLGKFILSFLFFKLTFVFFYFLAVFYLNKINKKYAIALATNPLVIVEGLVNSHNDFIAVSLGIVGVYFLLRSRSKIFRLFFLLSAGIKYISFPLIFLTRNNKKWNKIIFAWLFGVLIYLSFKSEIQPWYFLNLFIFLPLIKETINLPTQAGRLDLFFFGLLVSYYPYIRLGGWDKAEKISLKHWIIAIALILNVVYLLILRIKKSEKKNVA